MRKAQFLHECADCRLLIKYTVKHLYLGQHGGKPNLIYRNFQDIIWSTHKFQIFSDMQANQKTLERPANLRGFKRYTGRYSECKDPLPQILTS